MKVCHRVKFMLAFVMVMVMVMTSVGCHDGPDTQEETSICESEIEGMTWETNGGGDIAFHISMDDEDSFVITVSRLNYQDVDVVLFIDGTTGHDDIHQLLLSIFNGQLDIQDYTMEPFLPTGTWTSITLSFQSCPDQIIDNIETGSELGDLYGFVADAATAYPDRVYPDSSISGLKWSTTGGGNLVFTVVQGTGTAFVITVEEVDFTSVNTVYSLTDSDSDIYSLVKAILEKTIDVYDHTFYPQPGFATGTWTFITLYYTDGQEIEINNIAYGSDLWQLYDFVSDKLEAQ